MSKEEVDSKLIETADTDINIPIKKSWKSKFHLEHSKSKIRPKMRHEIRDLARMQKWLYQYQNMRSYYYTNCHHLTGRVNPWCNILLLVIWTTVVLFLHRNYVGQKVLGFDLSMEINNNATNYLGVALGYLLYMQASVSSRRWWRGRIEYQ